MDMLKHLIYITKLKTNCLPNNVRAVSVAWKEKENTAVINFYLDGESTDEEIEDLSVISTEIIAHCANALLEENFIRLDYPGPLPAENIAYRREEK
jgi:hypothetical protein